MYYTIYSVTNKINGKIYIGKHKTKNLNDGYMGSGVLITRAINKYGLENFEKKILFIFSNKEEMDKKEKELVNRDFVLSENTYNLALGGKGGWDLLKAKTARLGKTHSEQAKRKISNFVKQNNPTKSKSVRSKISEKHKGRSKLYVSDFFKGKPKTKEHKLKISETLKNRDKSKIPKGYKRKNKQMWINDGIRSTRINESSLIPKGFIKGRLPK